MRFYNQQHRFYCGVDLHARTMYLCILDTTGQVVFDKNLPANPNSFLQAIAPFRDDLVVAVECLFTWYWLADLCDQEKIAFVLGHALYMKAIHGGKSKNDQIDAAKIARLLRGGNIPIAYVYPAGMPPLVAMGARTAGRRFAQRTQTVGRHQPAASGIKGPIGLLIPFR